MFSFSLYVGIITRLSDTINKLFGEIMETKWKNPQPG